MTLNELAIHHNTDKADFCHNYCPIYQSLFDDRRFKAIDLFEIGIGEGASLKMWADYFPFADIYGIDIETFNIDHERIKTFVAHQEDKAEMHTVLNEIDTFFDIIIDDGSHDADHIIKSLEMLYPYLKSGGIYCIEDVEHPRRDLEHRLTGYNYWFATSSSQILNSNIVVIKKY